MVETVPSDQIGILRIIEIIHTLATDTQAMGTAQTPRVRTTAVMAGRITLITTGI